MCSHLFLPTRLTVSSTRAGNRGCPVPRYLLCPAQGQEMNTHLLHTCQTKQISYISTYMWNLEKWCRGTYFQNRNGDTNREQIYRHQVGNGGGINWEVGIHIYTLLCIKQITNENLLYNTRNYLMFSADLNGMGI